MLKPYFENVIADLNHLKIKIHLTMPENIQINLRKLSFNRCLTNLLLNSDRYGTQSWISVESQDKNILIHVDDNGPGIPVNEMTNVFKPFYRVDESRSLETGGVGLGLSIARNVVLSHGGSIKLEKSPFGGLRVSIKIPF
jgi:two-component system osmolarity sensor histidine kinase EnvZ